MYTWEFSQCVRELVLMMKPLIDEMSSWMLTLLFILSLKPTLLLAASLTCPGSNYKIHSKPIYFLDESENVVDFRGSTIELHCYASCEQDCVHKNKIYHNGSPELYHTIIDNNRNLTLTITNASVSDSGIYQCLRNVWPWNRFRQIAGKEIHLQIIDLRPTEHQVKFLSNGDSVFLPCTINASSNVYPMPDSIEWWKDDDQLEYGEDSYITQSGSLLLTNVSANASYHCVVHWKDSVPSYNSSHYQLVIGQQDTYHISVYPESLKAKVGESVQFVCAVSGFGQNYSIKWYNNNSPENALPTINHSNALDIPQVQLNDSGNYYCVVKSESGTVASNTSSLQVIEPPQIISITSDILINISIINNVNIYCSFTGDLMHTTVYWSKGDLNLADNTTIKNDTMILSLTINAKDKTYLGSYQCVVKNKVGYASHTTRVLPKGWTTPPKNFKAMINYYSIENCSIIVSWEPPVYIGGLPIQCYWLDVSYGDSKNDVLGECLTTTFYSWDGCQFISRDDPIKFKIAVVDEYKNRRSSWGKENLTPPDEILLNLMLNCTRKDVTAYWSLTSYPYNVNEYCLKYWCGSVEKEMCNIDRAVHSTVIEGIPVHAGCRFVVTAKRAELDSNYASCTTSAIIDNLIDQTVTEGNAVTFSCQAVGEPIPIISWYFNDILVNQSAKYEILTERLNHSCRISTLTVKSVEPSDAGTYTCYATNGVSTDYSSGVLSVNVVPSITFPEESEQAFNVTEGDNITCTATGYPEPDIVWLNNDGSVVDKSRVVTGSVMATGVGNVSSVSVSMIVGRSDSGVYKCLATNSVGNDASTISIVTIQSIPIIDIAKEHMVTEGDSITCTATGFPVPDIVWLKNNGSVVHNNRLKNSSVMATDVGSLFKVSVSMTVRRNDGGVYKCVANNSIGKDTSTIKITVNSIPIITIPKESTVTEGDNITCIATGYPEPRIVWLSIDGSIVGENRTKIAITARPTDSDNIFNKSVSIIVGRGDGGTYTCVANNSIGNDTNISIVTVQSLPIILILEEYTVTEGDSITCTATGYPEPDIVWLKNDGSVVDENRQVNGSVMATGVGNVSSVSVSMIVGRNDGGVYKCVANNSVGNNTSTINIIVQSIPIITITETEHLQTVTEHTYVVTDHEDGSITCTATGYPEPDIVWLNDDGSVVDKNRLAIGSAMAGGVSNLFNMSVLMIVGRNDIGIYTCVANNSIGNNTINITVRSNPVLTSDASYVNFWLLTLLLLIAVILFIVILLTYGFIKRSMQRTHSTYQPPEIFDTKDEFDEYIRDTHSQIDSVFMEDNISDCSSIKDVEEIKMLEEISYPPVYKRNSVVSAASSDTSTEDGEMPPHSHYFADSSSIRSNNIGNSVQTQQQYDSGCPIFDNELPATNEGSAYNDR